MSIQRRAQFEKAGREAAVIELRSLQAENVALLDELSRLRDELEDAHRKAERRIAAETAARQRAEREASRFHALLISERIRKLPAQEAPNA